MTPHCSPAHFCAFFVLLRTFAHTSSHFKIPAPAGIFFRTGSFAELAKGTKGFEVKNAFLKFTTTGIVTLEGKGLFSTGDTYTTTDVDGGTYYVAINPTNAKIAFKASSYGAEIKSTEFDFDEKKIYDLKTLTTYNLYIEDNSGYMKMYVHGWNIANQDVILGTGWPGVEAKTLDKAITKDNKKYTKVIALSDKVVATGKYGFVLNNGGMGSQYGDYTPTTLANNLYYTANPKNLIYIKASGVASGEWKSNLYCYIWKENGNNKWSWPGEKVNTNDSYDIYGNGEKYYLFDAGESKNYNRLIINKNGNPQTGNITIPNVGKGNGVEVKTKDQVYIWGI